MDIYGFHLQIPTMSSTFQLGPRRTKVNVNFMFNPKNHNSGYVLQSMTWWVGFSPLK
jgi:hypothetical protein